MWYKHGGDATLKLTHFQITQKRLTSIHVKKSPKIQTDGSHSAAIKTRSTFGLHR